MKDMVTNDVNSDLERETFQYCHVAPFCLQNKAGLQSERNYKTNSPLNLQTLNDVKGKENVVPQANGKQVLLTQRLEAIGNPVM